MMCPQKVLLAVAKCHKTLPSQVIMTWVLGDPFILIAGCQAPHNDVIAICNVLSRLPKRVNGEAGRLRGLSLETARGFQFPMELNLSWQAALLWMKGPLVRGFILTQNWITLADNPFTLKELLAVGIQPCLELKTSGRQPFCSQRAVCLRIWNLSSDNWHLSPDNSFALST